MRFLHECPWTRLKELRQAVPNILFQMLLRGANAVGYAAYPDNLVSRFIVESWNGGNGMDIFRIFDSLNWLEGMKNAIHTVVNHTGGIAEACICYTGDFFLKDRQKYSLQYYIDLARRLEDEGAHILAIKDMAGLLKPYQADVLVRALKQHLDIPIHLHTHDTSGIQPATYLKAIEAGVDIIDVALGSMSGLTSQPNFNSMVAIMKGSERDLPLDLKKLNEFSNYWEVVREYYYPFESELKAGTAEVFDHEIPGGQYSNLLPQARSLGLESKFEQIKENYSVVNALFGDIVKVTPSSKVVGDMALFMTSNNYTAADIWEKGETMSFPESVKQLFRGDLGQPFGGFPPALQKIILKEEMPYTDLPNAHLAPTNFEAELGEFYQKFDSRLSILDFLSYKMYPKVFEEYYAHQKTFGDVSKLPTLPFFFPMQPNQEILVGISRGKNVLIRYMYMTEPNEDGERDVFFKINGQTRSVHIKDRSIKTTKAAHRKATGSKDIGAPLQGKLSKVNVKAGDSIHKNQPLFVVEAMKMETTVNSALEGVVKEIILPEGTMLEQDDCILVFE
jgi:pyruvate carboxylase